MTREEAIRLLGGLMFKSKLKEALDMAIKALEQEPSYNGVKTELEPCDDCISRQAVLDAMRKNHRSGGRDVDGDYVEGSYDEHLHDDVISLPPVTPQPKVGHWIKTPKAVMGEGYMWYCDQCEHKVYQDSSKSYPSEKYCPNCGAKMQEVE